MKTDYGDCKLFRQECIPQVSHQKCDFAAILFMLIRWSQIKTQLGKRASGIQHTLFMLGRMSDLCIA